MTPGAAVAYDVVVPTTGRASLEALLASLAVPGGPAPVQVLVVDDRPGPPEPLAVAVPPELAARSVLLRTGGRGPAAARNAGWRAGRSPWTVFLDDDVVVTDGWRAALARDLRDLPPCVAGSQARIHVPLPPGRPTDAQRNVAALEDARWITADMAVRRAALHAVGGFDERFPRAYREDADLGLRLARHGLSIAVGTRTAQHPVPPATGRWTSVRKQAGNVDDALMRALHGRRWREACGTPRGRLAHHAATTASALVAGGALATGARRPAALAGTAFAAATGRFAWARIAPGPRTRDEVLTMALTSAVIPFAATAHRLHGEARARRLTRPSATAATAARPPRPARPQVVLLDRDGTLVRDVPYNGDPALVEPLPGVAEGLERLRAAGIRLAIVSNQSGVGRGLLTAQEVAAVNRRVVQLLGFVDHVVWCPHTEQDGCACRKPQPGMLHAAARALRADPLRCVMIGDIGADMEAARAAGMRGILVPTAATRRDEIRAAAETATTFAEAVDRLLAAAPVPAVTVHPLGVPELHAVDDLAVAR